MTQTQLDSVDETKTRMARLKEFGRIFGITMSDTDGMGSITTAEEPTDEGLDCIQDVTDSGTLDPANVVALVFDREKWGEIPEDLIEKMEIPAESLEVYDDDGEVIKVVSKKGNKTFLTADYVDNISTLIGVDLREEPESILLNEEDEYPVRVNDTKSDAEILLAPRRFPEGE